METILLDTSFLGAQERVHRGAARPDDWTNEVFDRLDEAVKAISPITTAEVKAGWLMAGLGDRRIALAMAQLEGLLVIPLDTDIVDEWARLRAFARSAGKDDIAHNDLWILATASTRQLPLVACDGDFRALQPAVASEIIVLTQPGRPPRRRPTDF